jgi:hypothetical protein
MAYQSDESGRMEIYVQSIPAGLKYQVSSAGGSQPIWRSDGKELFYQGDEKLMAMPIAVGASVEFGRARELFSNEGLIGYDVSADGQRFLLNAAIDQKGVKAPPVTVVLGWTTGLAN